MGGAGAHRGTGDGASLVAAPCLGILERFPTGYCFVGFFAALLVANGQAAGLLFALMLALLSHLSGLAFRQMQLYRANRQLELEKRVALQADQLKS
jgi:uncharacterized protein (DUF58 family)